MHTDADALETALITRLREKREMRRREREKIKIHETEGNDTIYTRMMSFG